VVFTLLLHLDHVLTSDEVAVLRRLCRAVLQLNTDDTTVDGNVQMRTHMLCTIVADFYGQRDLFPDTEEQESIER
jgi:hypothetical protein